MNKYIAFESNPDNLIQIANLSIDIISDKVGGVGITIVLPNIMTFNDIKNLFTSGDAFSYYEGDETSKTLKSTYKNFCKGLHCSYSQEDSTFIIKLTKKSDAEVLSESNAADGLVAYMAIADLYEAKLNSTVTA